MLEMDNESKITKKLLVIKEICSWLQTFRPSIPGGSQEHIDVKICLKAGVRYMLLGYN